ncbi:MAG: hypothetical protein V1793_03095 [Pseudomonadota bacterium]
MFCQALNTQFYLAANADLFKEKDTRFLLRILMHYLFATVTLSFYGSEV